ncbi:MAG: M16 family metallopeptidase [Bdellovibrionia bacterium]
MPPRKSRAVLVKKTNPGFKKTVLSNGLTVVSERLEGFKSLSLGVWVKIGTRHESPKVAGVSHFLEHMLFKGTQKRSALDIARQVDQVGGEFNAFTAREHTCFHLLMLQKDYRLGLDILSDILLHSTFKEEEFERERKVILQEISMVEESPEELAYDIFYELVYPNQGLGRPILGSTESIAQMKRQDLVDFFLKHYRPDQLVIAAAGDLSHDAVLKSIEPLKKESWPGRQSLIRKRDGIEDNPPFMFTSKKQKLWWVERDTEQVHLIWGVPGIHYGSKDRFAAFLLNVYLGGGMSSSLFQEIREKNGLAYTVYSSLSPFVDSGVFSIYAATGMQQVPLCLKLIEKCIAQIKKKPLPKKELKMIQDNLKGTILLSADSVESRMSSIAKNDLFLNKAVTLDEVCRQIDQVTPEDLSRVANQLFQEDQRSILALGPKPHSAITSQFQIDRPKKFIRKSTQLG